MPDKKITNTPPPNKDEQAAIEARVKQMMEPIPTGKHGSDVALPPRDGVGDTVAEINKTLAEEVEKLPGPPLGAPKLKTKITVADAAAETGTKSTLIQKFAPAPESAAPAAGSPKSPSGAKVWVAGDEKPPTSQPASRPQTKTTVAPQLAKPKIHRSFVILLLLVVLAALGLFYYLHRFRGLF